MYPPHQLWQRCADWLIRLSVLPSNHVVVGSSGTLQDLAYTLRDGVVLCHVALALDPQVSQAVPILFTSRAAARSGQVWVKNSIRLLALTTIQPQPP